MDVTMLYPTDTPVYASWITFILMNIIKTLSSVALYLLTAPVTTPFDHAVLTFSNVGDAFAVDNVTFVRIKLRRKHKH